MALTLIQQSIGLRPPEQRALCGKMRYHCLTSNDWSYTANTRHRPNVVLMLARRLWRRANNKTILSQCIVFAWYQVNTKHLYHIYTTLDQRRRGRHCINVIKMLCLLGTPGTKLRLYWQKWDTTTCSVVMRIQWRHPLSGVQHLWLDRFNQWQSLIQSYWKLFK